MYLYTFLGDAKYPFPPGQEPAKRENGPNGMTSYLVGKTCASVFILLSNVTDRIIVKNRISRMNTLVIYSYCRFRWLRYVSE